MAKVRDFFGPLRTRLLFLVLLAVLPLLGLVLYSDSRQRHHAVYDVQQDALRLAQLVATDQERLVIGTKQLLIALAEFPAVRNQDASVCTLFFADLLSQYPLYQNLTAVNAEGDVFCSAVQLDAKLNVADRRFFQQVLETRDFAAGEYSVSRITGKSSMDFAYPVLDDTGEVRTVVVAGLDLDWLDTFVAEAPLPGGATLSVVDRSGTVLARYPDPEKWRGSSLPAALMQPIFAQTQGVYDAIGADNTPRLYGFARLCCVAADIYVRVGIPQTVAFAEADRDLFRNLLIIAIVTLLALATTWLAGRAFVLQPVTALLSMVRRLDRGEFHTRAGPIHGSPEFSMLAQALDQMATTVERRETELRDETARAEALTSIAARINSQLDLKSVLNAVCKETASALGVQAACVGLYDENEGVTRIAARCGLPGCFCEQAQDSWKAILAQPIEQAGSVFVTDVAAPREVGNASAAALQDIHTLVGAPMVREEELIGVIWGCTPGEPAGFPEEDAKFLRAISDLAAQAVVNARLYESLQQEERRRAELVRGLISAQEDERRRIARELHDETSQGLTALMIGLESVDMALQANSDETGSHIQTTKSIARKTLMDIRRLVGDLRPSLLDDLGLMPAIAWYAKQRLEPLGIELDLNCDCSDTRLPLEYETALFRIVQEAITNVVKHSQASKVSVDLHALNGQIILRVADNGRGFDLPPDANGEVSLGHFGLQGIQERVSILGGEFGVQTAPQQGTVLEARVPLTQRGDSA